MTALLCRPKQLELHALFEYNFPKKLRRRHPDLIAGGRGVTSSHGNYTNLPPCAGGFFPAFGG